MSHEAYDNAIETLRPSLKSARKYRLTKLNDRLCELTMTGEFGELITVGRFWDPRIAQAVCDHLNDLVLASRMLLPLHSVGRLSSILA